MRLEVKQTAARQTWAAEGASPSVASFDIAARKGRYEGSVWVEEPGRPAHLFIFAHRPVNDATADHRDPMQWQFYVVGARLLPSTKRIGLSTLRQLTSACGYLDLADAVRLAAGDLAK